MECDAWVTGFRGVTILYSALPSLVTALIYTSSCNVIRQCCKDTSYTDTDNDEGLGAGVGDQIMLSAFYSESSPLLLLLSSPSQSLVSLTPTHSLGTPSKPHNNGRGWDVLIRDGSWRKVANKQYDLS